MRLLNNNNILILITYFVHHVHSIQNKKRPLSSNKTGLANGRRNVSYFE